MTIKMLQQKIDPRAFTVFSEIVAHAEIVANPTGVVGRKEADEEIVAHVAIYVQFETHFQACTWPV